MVDKIIDANTRVFLVQATVQYPQGMREIERKVHAKDSITAWNWVKDLARDQGAFIIHNCVKEILKKTGELVDISPPYRQMSPVPLHPQITREVPKLWYELPAFNSARVIVAPSSCTYKESES
jgi:hypothetical protein